MVAMSFCEAELAAGERRREWAAAGRRCAVGEVERPHDGLARRWPRGNTELYTGIIFSHRRQTVGMDMWPECSSHLDVYLDSLSLLIYVIYIESDE